MLWFLLQLILYAIILIITYYFYINSNDNYWPKRSIPLIKPNEIGTIWERMFLQIPLFKLDTIIYNKLKPLTVKKGYKYGGYMEFREPLAFIIDLNLLKCILVKDFDYFINRRGIELREDDPTLFHKMLFNVENQQWKDLRSSMSPAFATGKIKKMFQNTIKLSSDRMVEFINQEINNKTSSLDSSDSGGTFDMNDILGRFTMDVIASAAFGVDSNNFIDKNSLFALMSNRFATQFDGINGIKLLLAIWWPKIFCLFRFNLLDIIAVKFFGNAIKKSIKHRNDNGFRRNDFLQLMLDAKKGQLLKEHEEEEGILNEEEEEEDDNYDKTARLKNYKASTVEFTDELILAQCLLFFLAGFDTSQTLMIFALYELAINPDIQEKLANEIVKGIGDDNENGLTYDTVMSLEYLDMVISETLRKYPPTTRSERRALKDYNVPGCAPIEKGRIIVIPIMQIHHDPEYYPEPDKFDPERFTAEEKAKRNPYSYLPFGIGPRSCIARRFAITESKCALANLLYHFRVEPSEKTQIPMELAWKLIIKPKETMWLKLIPRHRV